MPLFNIEALDAQGQPYHATQEAETAYAAIVSLRDQGYHVHSVRPAGFRGLFARGPRRLSAEELGLLSEHLATLVEGNMPISPALRDMARELKSRRLRRLLQEVQQDIERGKSLEEAFGRHLGQLPPIFISLVRAGEQTGNLPGVLRQITDYTQGLLRLKYRLQSIVAYPTVLVVFLLFFLGLFVTTVVPQFAELYHSFARRLPFPTRVVLNGGWLVALLAYPLLLLALWGFAFTFVISGFTAFRSTLGHFADIVKFRIPLVGGLYQTVLTARFCRTLGILLGNGTQAMDALQLAGGAAGNRLYAHAAIRAAQRVGNGTPIGEAIESMGLLRHSTCWMLKQGERNGLFEQTLLRVADTLDREAERREQRLLGILGPAMVWAFGIIIGFIVTALYMPILQLSSLVAS